MNAKYILGTFWEYSIKPSAEILLATVLVVLLVGVPVGSMFGIAWIVDTYGDGWVFLFIPWFIGIATASKCLFD